MNMREYLIKKDNNYLNNTSSESYDKINNENIGIELSFDNVYSTDLNPINNQNSNSNLDLDNNIARITKKTSEELFKKYSNKLLYTYDYEYNKFLRKINKDKYNDEEFNKYEKDFNSYFDYSGVKSNSSKNIHIEFKTGYIKENLNEYIYPDEMADKYYRIPKVPVTFCFNFVKRIVSGGRIRFIDKEVDLDLSFITKRVIAMCFPTNKCFESLYRNTLDEVEIFFQKYLDNNVKVSN